MRGDGRLGQAVPTDAPLDHVCRVCEGAGDRQGHCYCLGLGVVTADRAAYLAETDPEDAGESDERWKPLPLAPVPRRSTRPCDDCAFRPASLERDGDTAAGLFRRLDRENKGMPFWCHKGMHSTDDGRYIPRQRDERGAPVGHPVCAGWVRAYEAAASRAADGE